MERIADWDLALFQMRASSITPSKKPAGVPRVSIRTLHLLAPAVTTALFTEALGILRARLPAGDRRIARVESALGACLGRQGRFDEGEQLLETSLATLATPRNPDTEDARGHLAELRAARARGS